jgi:hypothetical protein
MPEEEKAHNGVFSSINKIENCHIRVNGDGMQLLSSQQIAEVNPVSDVKKMNFLYVRKGSSLMIKRAGYMNVRKKAHVIGLKVSEAVSIAGAEPNHRKRSHLPGHKANTKKNVKCV